MAQHRGAAGSSVISDSCRAAELDAEAAVHPPFDGFDKEAQ
jgi:hypothetical protein